MKHLLFAGIITFLFSCQADHSTDNDDVLTVTMIPSPCQEGGMGRLFTSSSGEVYLSWVEFLNDTTDALLFSKLEGEEWRKPTAIASGSNWFVNWADFPALVAFPNTDQQLAAHWLQMRAAGTYDYDIHISQSADGGRNWSNSFIPHRDSIAAEHGFVSLLPLSKNRVFASWLDGRNTKGEEQEAAEDHGHGHHGAMSLRAAEFDPTGKLYAEAELDAMVCDCCQTSAALTADGPIVAYRDRTEDEIRDISVVRRVNGQWLAPMSVYKDNWNIAGCPVNGPSIKAVGQNVAIAWFSGAASEPEVKLAFSTDSGASFGPPVRVDKGDPMGRVAVEFIKEDEVMVLWMERTDSLAEIRASQFNFAGEKPVDLLIGTTAASRQSGFPVMTRSDDELYFAWTQADSSSQVQTARIKLAAAH